MKHGAESIIALSAAIREQANEFIAASLERRGVTDLLPAHGAVLNALFRQSPLRMNELARAIGRKKNTVTSLVGTLEERGYCRREADPEDARAQLVALTEKGAAVRAVSGTVSAELLQTVWDGVDENEKTACVNTLRAILANLGRGNTKNRRQ